MKRLLFLLLSVGVAAVIATASRSDTRVSQKTTEPSTDVKVAREEKNPWTHLNLNNAPDTFRFAIVTDRTGSHREKVFSRAVQQLNMMQPEFVVSVGDLIEGYTTSQEKLQAEWKEFDGYVKQLQMPFFYVPGNHDLHNKEQVEEWRGRYGRKFYHFLYKDVLFLAVNSEDPADAIASDQIDYFREAIKENPNVRWVFVFVHKPLWTAPDLEKNGWSAMEKLLEGKKATIFCGHVHRYKKYVRNGRNYYQLATTGGGSFLRGVSYGEFDHITWVTMKKEGPIVANVLLDGVLAEDLSIPDSDEKGFPRKVEKTYPVAGKVTRLGKVLPHATIRLHRQGIAGRFEFVAEGYSDGEGQFQLSTLKAFDGAPEGEFIVSVMKPTDGGPAPFHMTEKGLLPELYATPKTSPLKAVITASDKNELRVDLKE